LDDIGKQNAQEKPVYESYDQPRMYKTRLLCTAQCVIFVNVFRVHKLNKMTIREKQAARMGKTQMPINVSL